ncbi:hypothetical protein [Neobacillus bataviensis]|uniref:hypothetical protein n=1 Tax=Neobacillus bataviensis TaxID=220685 RepID=UPI001CBB9109|nr:hypothetical protein [Neobacillus bataviensis]
MKRFLRIIIRLVLIIGGFLFIFNLPSLLGIGRNHVVFNFETFWGFMKSDFQSLLQIKDAAYLSFFKQLDIAESYQYSMTILFFSLIFIIFMGLVFAVLIMLAPEKLRNILKSGINFFEAVPDL